MTTAVRRRRAPARAAETKPERPVEQAERVPDGTRSDGRLSPSAGALPQAVWSDAAVYGIDAWQRGVLFLDTLRERADNMLDHEAAGLPPLLKFEYETVLDARTFDPPANYALLHITETEDDCAADCVDPDKPPVIVIDPRAGHGPGIGGFKRDSEVGIALHEGHEVYFVIFFPEPCPGQTLADVLAALRHFIEAVRERHGGKAPVLYGNCQAGWAAVLLAADCQGLTGPVVLNGSPLSYWAGEAGVNPMRLFGGLLGGTWLPHLLADIGNGEFDGAWLAQNFELLKPEAAIWDKYAHLFMNVDDERERFLEFERWWNGFYRLSREEIVAIVEDLFVGNKLEEGKVQICEGCHVDLRQIRNPLVIFASYGDNITPPQQALGWLPAVYDSTDDLKQAGQRIVYLTNPHVGHLGIFVSAKVARFEHRAILESLDEIEALPPGLFEMKIINPTGDPDCRKPQYAVAFEERKVEDLRFGYPEQAFERARDISERNEALYSSFVRPWVQAWANPWTAEWLRWAHPMRASRYVFSERINPGMIWIKALAGLIGQHRQNAAAGNPWLALEQAASHSVGDGIRNLRTLRDELYEVAFQTTYGRE
jgi:pimeloyl-ACP methyl ester carboxylesterase